MSLDRQYDLVLTVPSFRHVGAYLPIIKALRGRFRIAVYKFQLTENLKRFSEDTDRLFVDKCVELGAALVCDKQISARLGLIRQWPYTAEQVADLRSKVHCERYHVLMALAEGNTYLETLRDLPVDKHLLVDRDLYLHRLRKPNEQNTTPLDPARAVEAGLPFRQHRVFEDLGIDYLLAMPTPYSLPDAGTRLAFLRCVEQLIGQMKPTDVIALKAHNAAEKYDYLLSERLFAAISRPAVRRWHRLLMFLVRGTMVALGRIRQGILADLREKIGNLGVAIRYYRLLQRVVPLKALTPYHNFSLELFLPDVRKGLITGRSNSIWHGLYNRLPVYNCVDGLKVRRLGNKTNYHTMAYLEPPYCQGRLEDDPSMFDRINDRVRTADLVGFLEQQLTVVPAYRSQAIAE